MEGGELWADDPRAESFVLRWHDGRVGRLVCGLDRQQVCAAGAEDGEVALAVRAWLLARGQRRLNLWCDDVCLASGPIAPGDLDTVPPEGVGRAATLVTLAPSNAEVVAALGAFDRVVAAEDSSDFPPEIAALPRLGPDLAPDLDAIARIGPGLAISSLTVPGMERTVVGLRAREIPQVVLAPRSVDEVLDDLRRVGRAIGADDAGARAAEVMEGEREALRATREADAASAPVPVYLEWWPRPMFTPGADCFSNELIELAGGRNVFGDRRGSSLEIQPAEVVSAAPAACFVSWCGVPAHKLDVERLVGRPGLEELEAARRGHVFPLDEQFTGRPGPRMLEAARRMREALAQVHRRSRSDA